MGEDQKAELEAMQEMFQSPGWAALMRNTQAQVDQFRAQFPFNVNSEKELWMARGTLATLETILRLEDSLSYKDPEPDYDATA